MTMPINELSDIELREAVAVEVMGYELREAAISGYPVMELYRDGVSHKVSGNHSGLVSSMPRYESSITAAFEVVAKLEAMGEHWLFKATRMIGVLRDNLDALAWAVEFRACIGPQGHAFYALGADRASLPRAICIAALTAIRARKA